MEVGILEAKFQVTEDGFALSSVMGQDCMGKILGSDTLGQGGGTLKPLEIKENLVESGEVSFLFWNLPSLLSLAGY